MTQKVAFSEVISIVRPLMKGTRRLGEFTAGIIDMGIMLAPDDSDERTALGLRAEPTWKGYANGNAHLPEDLASEIAGGGNQRSLQ